MDFSADVQKMKLTRHAHNITNEHEGNELWEH